MVLLVNNQEVLICVLDFYPQTNRIARILAGSKKKICTKKPRFMSACAQLIIAFLLILLQLGIIVALFLMEPPEVRSDGHLKVLLSTVCPPIYIYIFRFFIFRFIHLQLKLLSLVSPPKCSI